MVRLQDPDGYLFEARYNMETVGVQSLADPTIVNYATVKHRQVNHMQRHATKREIRPPQVWRLGHVVYGGINFIRTLRWVQRHLGVIVSDCQMMESDPLPCIAFCRLDRGDAPTDHHSIALASLLVAGFEHAAFEVQDFDEVGLGQRYLEMQGHKNKANYRHAWGIGRHVLGSQIFDYWRDDSDGKGEMFEHYADGDMHESTHPTGYHLITETAQHQMGTLGGPPKVFTEHLSPIATVQHILPRLFRGDDDLTLSRLGRFAAAIGQRFREATQPHAGAVVMMRPAPSAVQSNL